jgi:hypothetical protein
MCSVTCYSWLLTHFKAIGDEEPNVHEIHLDPVDEKDVHKEYSDDLRYHLREDDLLCYSEFCNVSTYIHTIIEFNI